MRQKNFTQISEALLWDNLKRKANETLRKIESEDLEQRLKIFKTPRFLLIQKLLSDIGKEFFRIFLFKALQEDQKKEKSFASTIEEFQFFFWPGYTTLEGNRIFIEGSKKPNSNKFRYFTGIGNKKLGTIKDPSFINYFLKNENIPGLLSENSSIWTNHIPATLAFDSLMNQFYLNEEGKINGNTFVAGSTHHWKSVQKTTLNGKQIYQSMRLKQDSSELRILEVNLHKEYAFNIVKNINNTISIIIPKHEICSSGDIIAENLDANDGPLILEDLDKSMFVPWPKGNRESKATYFEKSTDDLYNLQKKAYSFWLSETLSYPDVNRNYGYIVDAFQNSPFQYLAERIKPFQQRITEIEDDGEFTEIYYQNWYTLFLESYSEAVDLGTGMFLTSHRYDQEFLMKCSHWIRWIYNELRLLEAAADVELRQKTEDERNISHDLTSHITTLRLFIDRHIIEERDKPLSDNLLSIYNYLYDSINSIVVTEKKNYKADLQTFNISTEIINAFNIFMIIASDHRTFDSVFRGIAQDEEVFLLFKDLRHCSLELFDHNIKTDSHLLRMLLKDIFENVVKHSRLVSPKCIIRMEVNGDGLDIHFLSNSIPPESTIRKMKLNSFSNDRTGWRKVMRTLKRMGWSHDVGIIKYEDTDYFRIKISNYA